MPLRHQTSVCYRLRFYWRLAPVLSVHYCPHWTGGWIMGQDPPKVSLNMLNKCWSKARRPGEVLIPMNVHFVILIKLKLLPEVFIR